MTKRRKGARRKEAAREVVYQYNDPITKNWDVPCSVCEQKPTVMDTALCGPCCFGEAETLGGNW